MRSISLIIRRKKRAPSDDNNKEEDDDQRQDRERRTMENGEEETDLRRPQNKQYPLIQNSSIRIMIPKHNIKSIRFQFFANKIGKT